MNASDSRNKKTLDQHVSLLLSNKSMDAFVGGLSSLSQACTTHISFTAFFTALSLHQDQRQLYKMPQNIY